MFGSSDLDLVVCKVRDQLPSLPPRALDVAVLSAGREGESQKTAAAEMARRWRRPGRRVLIVATFATAAVGAALGVLLTQCCGSTASAAVGANAVGVIDSESGKIVSEIPVGGAPGEVAAGPDVVWVTNSNDNSVSRIDSSTNDVRQTIQVGGGPAGVAVGGAGLLTGGQLPR